MGVGDYVHSKEAGQHRPPKLDVSNQSRQQIAEQARVEVPTPKLIAPTPLPINRPTQFEHYGGPPAPGGPQGPNENGAKKDMFDTDVEGIDDSTIAATSVAGVEDLPYRFSPAPNARQQGAAANTLHQFQQTRRPFDSQWYDNFGDRALKTAGFDSDETDNESQLTSVAGDDEASDGTNESVVPIRKRLNDEPLSKRLQNFWNAGRKTYHQPENQAHVESKIPTFTRSIQDAKRTSQVLPAAAPRKVTLPPNTNATPRTRFSPPKPTLLEQLDLTPTRRTPGPRPQQSQRITSIETSDSVENVGLGFFSNNYGRRGSMQSITAFDVTNIDALNDDDDPINDPFSRRLSVQRISPDQHNPKKRHIEPDYPPDILYQKSFAELQAEPFDHIPAAAPSPNATQETQPDPEDKIPYLMNLSDADRRTYFSNLSMDEWEDCGDQLIDQFTQMLTKMKDLRHARRKTAAMFEAEVKRRHESVEEQSSDLSRKLDEMRTGGVEVLRGRTP
ncbi:extracellular mutant protein 11-domain-containing protein [Aspergillus caelatus]|uniref:Extracellular mutant protein 11-domain-containing protein n=1 Tax=Aspergillus caelatus TaxID=61420 RepID=A0A5N7A4T2_9EURO|nr:extracellular mutant protein 11-domain-containing protein [Aspergillus caelatus]KAE8364867.1 extracellular mutant protein 11-domain-containing protein [Aspergillus caelatus]